MSFINLPNLEFEFTFGIAIFDFSLRCDRTGFCDKTDLESIGWNCWMAFQEKNGDNSVEKKFVDVSGLFRIKNGGSCSEVSEILDYENLVVKSTVGGLRRSSMYPSRVFGFLALCVPICFWLKNKGFLRQTF